MMGVNVCDRAVNTGVRGSHHTGPALLTLIVLIMFRRNLGRIMMGTVIMRRPLLWPVGRDTGAEDCETEIES